MKKNKYLLLILFLAGIFSAYSWIYAEAASFSSFVPLKIDVPSDKAAVYTLTPLLNFYGHDNYGASAVYEVEITDMASSLSKNFTANADYVIVPAGMLDWNKNYKWRVRVCEDKTLQNCNQFSDFYHFTTSAAGIDIVRPLDGEKISGIYEFAVAIKGYPYIVKFNIFSPKEEKTFIIEGSCPNIISDALASKPINCSAKFDSAKFPNGNDYRLTIYFKDIQGVDFNSKPVNFSINNIGVEVAKMPTSENATSSVLPPGILQMVAKELFPAEEAQKRIFDIVSQILSSDANLEQRQKVADFIENSINSILQSKQVDTVGIEQVLGQDGDADGIADYQEIVIFKTDILKVDTDNDGFSDGEEVLSGYDPLNQDSNPSAGKGVVFGDPKISGEEKLDVLKIERVELALVVNKIDYKEIQENRVKLNGKATPFSLARVYVYGEVPIIVAVKADQNGNWSYTFDQPLKDGTHEAFVTINDGVGKVLLKSKKFSFIKTAQAITEMTVAQENMPISSNQEIKRNYTIIIASVVLAVLAFGIYMACRAVKKSKSDIG